MNRFEKVCISLILISIAIVSFTAGMYITNPLLFSHREPSVSMNVYMWQETQSGSELVYAGNVITNIGEKRIRDAIGYDNASALVWAIALSNDASPVQTWAVLPTELTNVTGAGFGRKACDAAHWGSIVAWYRDSDYSFNATVKFMAETDGIQVRCASLTWSDVEEAADAFAVAAFTQTTFNTNDNCTITWIVQFNAN
jgi:hypothetical protein